MPYRVRGRARAVETISGHAADRRLDAVRTRLGIAREAAAEGGAVRIHAAGHHAYAALLVDADRSRRAVGVGGTGNRAHAARKVPLVVQALLARTGCRRCTPRPTTVLSGPAIAPPQDASAASTNQTVARNVRILARMSRWCREPPLRLKGSPRRPCYARGALLALPVALSLHALLALQALRRRRRRRTRPRASRRSCGSDRRTRPPSMRARCSMRSLSTRAISVSRCAPRPKPPPCRRTRRRRPPRRPRCARRAPASGSGASCARTPTIAVLTVVARGRPSRASPRRAHGRARGGAVSRDRAQAAQRADRDRDARARPAPAPPPPPPARPPARRAARRRRPRGGRAAGDAAAASVRLGRLSRLDAVRRRVAPARARDRGRAADRTAVRARASARALAPRIEERVARTRSPSSTGRSPPARASSGAAPGVTFGGGVFAALHLRWASATGPTPAWRRAQPRSRPAPARGPRRWPASG